MVATKFKELEALICQMISSAGAGHYASSMSALEIMYPLFYEQGVKPDEFILSKGHAAPALYAILYDLGYVTKEQIDGFREYKGLPGHPSIETNGVLASSGSLGMGISKAVGLALANPDKVYHVLVGDGELQEGQNYEAIGYLIYEGIKNIFIHIDDNEYQYSGIIRAKNYFAARQIIRHRTTWRESNKYLTHPQNEKYDLLIKKYSKTLIGMMIENEKIIILDGDLEHDFGLTKVKEVFPKRFIECGISEQHMVSMANGLALAGYLPICHTFGAFYRRCIDQIYNNCCDKLKIIYVAGLCGDHKQNVGKSHSSNNIWTYFAGMGCLVERIGTITELDEAMKSMISRSCSIMLNLEM